MTWGVRLGRCPLQAMMITVKERFYKSYGLSLRQRLHQAISEDKFLGHEE